MRHKGISYVLTSSKTPCACTISSLFVSSGIFSAETCNRHEDRRDPRARQATHYELPQFLQRNAESIRSVLDHLARLLQHEVLHWGVRG